MNKKTKKRTLSMALAAALAFSPVQALAASSDIAGHWAEDVITQWENAGMISGYEDGTFRPNNSVTRAEFVIMMNNALGLTETGEVSFSDVQPGNWFYNAVAVAVAAGYCSGYEDGTFKPSATITRAEAAVMIANAAGLTQDATGAAAFTDSIPAWAQGSVGAVVNAGFMSGYPDGTFAANQSITRAEAVSSLNRVIGGVTANDVVVTEATEIADQTIDGNLIIDAALTDGKVSVKNTTVKGNIVVRGGSADALTLDGVTLEGKLIVEKEDAEVVLTGDTAIPSAEISALSTLSADSFTGSVGTITITKDLDTSKTVKLSVPADKLVLDGVAAVDVNDDITTVEVTTNAEDSKVYVNKGATVDTVIADAKASVSGSGTVKVLEANADGITVGSSLTVNKTEVAEGVQKPTTTTGGSGGGGGGSSSSVDDDDDIPTVQTIVDGTTTTWTDAVAQVNAANAINYKILVRDGAGTSPTATGDKDKIVFKGTGTLTIEFENGSEVTSGDLDITALNAARVELKDAGAGSNGVELDNLTINTPKATVNSDFAVNTKTTVTAVSNATFNAKDKNAAIEVQKGTVNVVGDPTANVTVKATGNDVKITGKVASITVTAVENLTIAAEVTGNVTTPENATKSIVVENGAKIGTLSGAINVPVTVKGGTVDTLASTGTGEVTVSGGTVDTLTGDAAAVTVSGGTVGKLTATTAATLITVSGGTVNAVELATKAAMEVKGGTVAKATLSGESTLSGTTVQEVKVADSTGSAPITVSVKEVDKLTVSQTTTGLTLENTDVAQAVVASGATGTVITAKGEASMGTLVANDTTEVKTAGATGTVVTDVVASANVKIEEASKVAKDGTITTNGTATVKDKEGQPINQDNTIAVKSVTLVSNTKTVYETGEALDLSAITLTINDKEVKTADTLGDALVVTGFDNQKPGKQTVTLTYVGHEVKTEVTVKMNKATWEKAAKDALGSAISTKFSDTATTPIAVGDEITGLPITIATGKPEESTVTWTSKDAYVKIEDSGNNKKAVVKDAERDRAHETIVTATLTSAQDASYSTTVEYKVTIKAVNDGAMTELAKIQAQIPEDTTIKLDAATLEDDSTTKTAVESKVQGWITAVSIASGYTASKTVTPAGDNTWTVALKVVSDSAAKTDYAEATVTLTVVDQAQGAKDALKKLDTFTTLPLDPGTLKTETGDGAIVNPMIKEKAEEIIGNGYEVEVTSNSIEKKDISATWKGTFKVTSTDPLDAATNTITSEERELALTEGQTVTTSDSISGDVTDITTDTITLTANNTTFNVTKGTDVTGWFAGPSGEILSDADLKATVTDAPEGGATITITVEMADKVTECKPVDGKYTITVPKANLVGTESDLVVENVVFTIKDVQKNLTITNVTGNVVGADTVTITLKNGKFGAGAETIGNYGYNNAMYSTSTVSKDSENTVTISLNTAERPAQAVSSFTIKEGAFDANTVVKEEDVTVEFSAANSIEFITAMDRKTAVDGTGQPEQVNDGKYTVTPEVEWNKDTRTYTIQVDGTAELVGETAVQTGSKRAGKYVGIALQLNGISIGDVKYASTEEGLESASNLTEDNALKEGIRDNSFIFYLDATGNNTVDGDELELYVTRYIQVENESPITLVFHYTPYNA